METRSKPPLVGPTAAIYGQILITALIAAYSDDKELGSLAILSDAAVTMIVFWIAHAYAATMSWRLTAGRRLEGADLRELIVGEWPMLRAALPACLALALGAIGLLSRDTSVYLAIGVGVAGLFIWALLIGYRTGPSRFPTMVGVAISGAL